MVIGVFHLRHSSAPVAQRSFAITRAWLSCLPYNILNMIGIDQLETKSIDLIEQISGILDIVRIPLAWTTVSSRLERARSN